MLKESKIRKKEIGQGIFRILDVANIYFPIMQKGERFKVVNTIFVQMPKKAIKKYDEFRLGRNPAAIGGVFFLRDFVEILWRTLKAEGLHRTYKDCWIVPIDIHEYSFKERNIEVVFDILKPVKKEKKK
jgi:hypothetical protein